MANPEGYDIIGDVHGHADELHQLLKAMGYHLDHGVFYHPSRKAIFVGDLIDRGTQNKMVVDTVKTMVEAETALCIMGNHEFNALAFHAESEKHDWLRPRSDKNLTQHIAFLYEYLNPNLDNREQELDAALAFFRSLPLYLDLGELRVIHACWHSAYLKGIRPLLNPDHSLSEDAIHDGHTPGTPIFDWLDVILKGHEAPLPDGHSYRDNYGFKRFKTRTRWWLNDPKDFQQWALVPTTTMQQLPRDPVPAQDIIGYPADAPPLFIGHYWEKGVPTPLAPNLACVDYSMGKGREQGGKLVAYRWSGEQTLSAGHFFYHQ